MTFVAAVFAREPDMAFDIPSHPADNTQLGIEAMLISEVGSFRRDARYRNLVKQVGLFDYRESTRWPAKLSGLSKATDTGG